MIRQIKYALAGMMMLGATPQLAQAQLLSDGFPLPVACAEFDIGTPECPFDTVREALDLLSPGFGRPFHDAGLESYAIMTELSEFKRIFAVIANDDDCMIVDEGLFRIAESLNFYLPDLDTLPKEVAREYLILDRFFGKAFRFAEKEMC